MDIQIGVIIAQIINFLIIFFLFKRFLGVKIVAAIEQRREYLQQANDSKQASKEIMEKAEKQKQEFLDEARHQAEKIRQDSIALAKNEAKKILEKAENEAKYYMDKAQETIESERRTMLEQMKRKILDTAILINKKVFSKQDSHKEFLEKQLSVLQK